MSTSDGIDRVAAAIDETMREVSSTPLWSPWEHVEWLRLKADLLDRLAAARDGSTGALARRAELVRDRAERLADQLNRVPQAPQPRWELTGADETEVVRMWAEAADRA
ncbi:hypothetical protein F0L68_10775 [Solihabitans fulvus]|uniref:Uncharacterized protein n=1 Tax=Solihabitans fulvus TaxID=1892852 RepID=A0A5B2XGL3_9PSEU|nr:hypothetical protein [Solihabitans fulvus]KAA2262948.1 hypothetical protein F0L68_10775 [Solihabitans fulvus]